MERNINSAFPHNNSSLINQAKGESHWEDGITSRIAVKSNGGCLVCMCIEMYTGGISVTRRSALVRGKDPGSGTHPKGLLPV